MDSSGIPGKALSLWMDTSSRTAYAALEGDYACDVAILGGGIVGLTAADFLTRAGRKVVVVEAWQTAGGVSGFTTAKITSLHTLIYKHLLDNFGPERAQIYASANQWAIEHIAERVAMGGIECDFVRDSAWTYAMTDDGREQVQQEVQAALKLGLPAQFVEEAPLPFRTRGSIKFDNQARFHPRKYLLALAETITTGGSAIFEQTRALRVEEHDTHCEVTTDRGRIKAESVIVATHYPFHDEAMYFARLSPQRSYALAVKVQGGQPDGMFISADEPERSVRRQPYGGEDILIVGGDVHKTGQDDDTVRRYLAVADWARENFQVEEFLYHWSTQDPKTPDGVPYIGRAKKSNERIFMASGFDGWGMTGGTVAGKLLSDLCSHRENEWAELYDPNRSEIRAARTLISENVNVGKHLLGDKIKGGQHVDPLSLKRGEAKVISFDSKTVAAYRDEENVLHAVSAACTHMGCTLHWNTAEKSWDCPCHGSRFDVDGKVLHGPAIVDLEPSPLEGK
jgi:glycine/D-amino acid oxidase-like deaminating enzyme/nitrite reductase/ring-hydroxylating ferredoxin subunit